MPKATIHILLYGHCTDLARRCIESVRRFVPRDEYLLRIGMNACCRETREYVDAVSRDMPIDLIVRSDQNIHKYPMMRKMFWDKPVETEWIVWFDDDTHIVSDAWWKGLWQRLTAKRADAAGQLWWWPYRKGEWEFVQKCPWYRGQAPQHSPGWAVPSVLFMTGSYWVIRTDCIRALDWPHPQLVACGGDTLLGSAIHQQQWRQIHFDKAIRVNDAPRRTAAMPRLGVEPNEAEPPDRSDWSDASDLSDWSDQSTGSDKAERAGPVRRSTLEIQILPKGERKRSAPPKRRGYRIAVSLVGMRLGDRILMDAPLRVHCRRYPQDYLIAVVDACDGVDIPSTIPRHFDEIWRIRAADGKRWHGSRRSAMARHLRDALIAEKVDLFENPLWQPKQLPRHPAYTILGYDCFEHCRNLSGDGIWPRYVVPKGDRRWAREFLAALVPDRFEALIAVHMRNIPALGFKNSNARLFRQVLSLLRAEGRFAFLLVGRDDGAEKIRGRDVFSLAGQNWHFDRMASVIAQTSLFIGGDSGPTHAAAALGVPVIGLGYPSKRIAPFTHPDRFILVVKGERPQTIKADVRRFVERFRPSFGRERGTCLSSIAPERSTVCRSPTSATT